MSVLTNNMRIRKNKAGGVSQGRLKCHIRTVFAVMFALAAVMLMSTAVFAKGTGTKDDPYIVTDEPGFVYYCQQGGYIKVEAEELNIYGTQINIEKDLNVDLGDCVVHMQNGLFTWYMVIYNANVTISSVEGGIIADDSNYLFHVGKGSLTLNGGAYLSRLDETIIATDSQVTVNSAFLDDANISGGKLTVNNSHFMCSILSDALEIPESNYKYHPLKIDGADFEFNGYSIEYLEISEKTAADSITLSSGRFQHILVKSSEYNISDLLPKGGYIVKNGEKVNADVKELKAGTEEYYEIVAPIEVSAVDVNITAPKAGKTPAVSAELNTDGVTLYKNDPITWYKDGDIMKNTDVFEVGHKYTLSVWLQAQDGYYFATDKSLSPAVTGSLNGTSATIGIAYEQAADEVINLSYDFGTLQKMTISAIEITVGIPQAGKTPDFAPTANAGCVLYADKSEKGYGIDWYDSDEHIYLDKNDVFKEGHSYIMEVFYKPDENYLFVNKMTASVNGVELKGYISPENSAKYKLIQVFYDIPVKGDVDGNGFVEDADAALLMKYITGVEPVLSELQLEAAKVTDSKKEKPDMLDVIAILKITKEQ
ncbi:MAG: hypothetical protein IJ062_02955 [Firmicutes bacterium]|nr:hypothetical protein [Bacillota bacterium]